VFFGAPIAHNIDSRQVSGEIYRYSDNRIRNVGIEGIRGVATIDTSETAVVDGQTVFTDEDHAENFINFSRVRDAWAQNVTGQHLWLSTVIVNGVSRSITVANAESVAPASEVTGSKRYAFNANGCRFCFGLFNATQKEPRSSSRLRGQNVRGAHSYAGIQTHQFVINARSTLRTYQLGPGDARVENE